jgi:WD40 repeat protein
MRKMTGKITVCLVAVSVLAVGCGRKGPEPRALTARREKIPRDAIKVSPQTDLFPPVVHSEDWEQPVSVGNTINTAGAEDSPFILPDGKTLYFWFTPDVRKKPQEQLTDGVTGIWCATRTAEGWSEPQRVVLSDEGNPSLDGACFVQEDTMWFGTVRKGNYAEVDMYTAHLRDGKWVDWKNAGRTLNVDYDIGELHITKDGSEMYFGSNRAGGQGGFDIWLCRNVAGIWQKPENVANVNSPRNENQPFITQDGKELWFTGQSRSGHPGPAVFRSVRDANSAWGKPEEIISSFAGEPSLDAERNIYFVHHFFTRDMEMIEADIYVAYHRREAMGKGSSIVRLTRSDADERAPAWSPDGKLIAYSSNVASKGDIFCIPAEEGKPVQATESEAADDCPCWSPDGQNIAFHSDREGDENVWTVDLTTKAVRKLTQHGGFDGFPAWSPDGKMILFQSDGLGNMDIWKMSSTGADKIPLTSDKNLDMTPAWSPDGKQIAFSSRRAGNADIWLLDVETGSLRQLTSDAADEWRPVWSPDGKRIAFIASGYGKTAHIWVVDSDGRNRMQATFGYCLDYNPTWSPDSTRIAFDSDRSGNRDIWVIELDGLRK